MYRIDSRGATADGRFTEGNPSTGTPATVVNAPWMNAVQDEIVNVIAAASIPLDKNNNAQLLQAVLALATVQIRALYPVGSIYINATDQRNPAQIFGFGTWAPIAGRAIFGFSSSEPEFDSAGETGGSKTHNHGGATGAGGDHNHGGSVGGTALTIDQIPPHTHIQRGSVDGGGQLGFQMDNNNTLTNPNTPVETASTGGGQPHAHGIGASGEHAHGIGISSSLPPYYTAFIWRRTA